MQVVGLGWSVWLVVIVFVLLAGVMGKPCLQGYACLRVEELSKSQPPPPPPPTCHPILAPPPSCLATLWQSLSWCKTAMSLASATHDSVMGRVMAFEVVLLV